MAKSVLILIAFLSIAPAFADFFGDSIYKSKIPELIEKLKSVDQSSLSKFDESFNLTVKQIEAAVEEEKLICSGEATDASGKQVGKDKKQLCFRELKNNYVEATDLIFGLKKKYLELVHSRQLDRLNEIQKKTKAEIEKSF